MVSSATVSVCSAAGEIILPYVLMRDHEAIQVLTKQVRDATAARHITLVSKTGHTLVDSLSARDNGIADGDQVTAVFGNRDVLWLLPVRSKYIVRYDLAAGTLSGIKHVGERRRETPYGGAVSVGNKTYFWPVDADHMFIYNAATEEVTSMDVSAYAEGGGKFCAAFVADNKIYLVPGRSNKLLVYDVATCEHWGVDITHVTGSRHKWHSAVLQRDNIIAFPCSAKAILVYNILTGEASGIPIRPDCRSLNVTGCRVVQHDGKIYVLPNEHNMMLIYDCDSRAVSEVEVDNVGKKREWVGGTVVDGRLFALPKNGNYIWMYDTVFQVSSRVELSMFAGGWGKMANIDGVIYCAPSTCCYVLVYNAKTGEISYIDASWYTQNHRDVFADVVVVHDKVLFVPVNAKTILVYDRTQNCTLAVDAARFSTLGGTSNWHFGVHVVEY